MMQCRTYLKIAASQLSNSIASTMHACSICEISTVYTGMKHEVCVQQIPQLSKNTFTTVTTPLHVHAIICSINLQ
jgi:hypothetical protein